MKLIKNLLYAILLGIIKNSYEERMDFQRAKEDCGIAEDSTARIIMHGSPVILFKYPWMVAIRNEEDIVFGAGALITPQHVLTAAHLFMGKSGEKLAKLRYMIGFLNIASAESPNYQEVFTPKSYKIHEAWNPPNPVNDIAIVTLNRPVPETMFENNHARLICLPTDRTSLSNEFVITGWGKNENRVRAQNLMEATADQLTNCNATYFERNGLSLPLKTLCTNATYFDTCKGDSGGPLMQQDSETARFIVAGITSFGKDCDRFRNNKTEIGVYTDVQKFLGWIELGIKQ